MQVSMEICIVPELHAYGINVEGEWEAVMIALRRCHEVVHEMGAPRIFTSLKLGTRTDRPQSNRQKVDSVRKQLNS